MGRRHNAHIDFGRLGAADSGEFPLLQHMQELGLGDRTQVADFIEKERAGMGQLELSCAPRRRVRERAFFMAEQFAFDQRSGNAAQLSAMQGRFRRELL